ncbi:hypothetical protein EYF80_021297 [Liparis tanakae]|uniref:Uncharacterized protein n=1 Tax=Liparis tanakae TaxID=230148 RepID=A0A4Z2HUE3_9TELE|nr:hypothetical protein EYF80_021297 [Liparis tanakae]
MVVRGTAPEGVEMQHMTGQKESPHLLCCLMSAVTRSDCEPRSLEYRTRSLSWPFNFSAIGSALCKPSTLINSWLHPLSRPSNSFSSSSSRTAVAVARDPSRSSLALRAAPSHCSRAWDSAPSCRSMASQPPAAVCSAVDAAPRRTLLRRSRPSSSRHSTRSWRDGEGCEVIKLHLQLGAGTVIKAGIASLLKEFSGFFFQTGQSHLMVFQVSQQSSESLELGGLFSGTWLRAHGSHKERGPSILYFLELRADRVLSGGSIAAQGQLTLTHRHIQLDLSLPLQKQDVLYRHTGISMTYYSKPPLTCTVSSLCSNCSLVPMVLSTVPSRSWISSSQAQTPWRVSPKAWLSWQPRSFSLAVFSRAWCSIWSWPVTLTSPPDPRPTSDRDWASWQRCSMESLAKRQ